MIEGFTLIDAHVHAPRWTTLKPAWKQWAAQFGPEVPVGDLLAADGTLDPARLEAYLDGEGVDVAILLCEYSPKATGIQPVEDLLPIVRHNPRRFRFLANLNPHLHYPVAEELERQLALGAVGLKLHPVHGGFSPADPALYPAYATCQARGIPVVFHCGTSVFPGATNRYADPVWVEEVARDFPGLTIVLAHGGRGWWYDAAAFMALMRPQVWIEISGLPPRRLPEYYRRFDFERLARKFIFGTDWPGVPGIRANALALMELGLPAEVLEAIFWKNAATVYRIMPG